MSGGKWGEASRGGARSRGGALARRCLRWDCAAANAAPPSSPARRDSSSAWVATSTSGTNRNHDAAECSNKGLCDRETGECQCFDGYAGIACERTVCPNDCNGRGVCKTQKALASAQSATYDTPWDAEKHVGCLCDLGYRGPDCSMQECPTGADVLGGAGGGDGGKGRDCSGRGICNYADGLCSCFPGYYGSKCEFQTILG